MTTRSKSHSPTQRLAHLQTAKRHRHHVWIALAAAIVLGAAGGIWYAVDQSGHPDKPATVPAAVSSDRAGVVVGSGPVTVELYSDFLCPACRAFENDARDDLDTLLAGNKIRLVYRPVAILDRMSTNDYSSRSASGAACASDAGKLMAYVRVLFDNQPAEGGAGWTDDDLVRLAGTAGLSDPGFGQCVRDGRYLKWVEQVTETMAPNNVLGTPTVFVAGQQLAQPTGERLVAAVTQAAG